MVNDFTVQVNRLLTKILFIHTILYLLTLFLKHFIQRIKIQIKNTLSQQIFQLEKSIVEPAAGDTLGFLLRIFTLKLHFFYQGFNRTNLRLGYLTRNLM